MQPLYEYVCHIKGHRNSNGELAEWVIKSHETGKILSSHKSEQKAKEHLQQMHIFNEAAEGTSYPKMYLTNFTELKSYKLIGESNDGNNMNNRVQFFMECVGQLGLSSSQLDTIEKLTKVCMESVMHETTEPHYVSYLFQDEADRNDIENMIDADGNIDNVVAEYGFLLDPSDPANVTEGIPYILEGSDIIIGTSGPYTLVYNGKMSGSYMLYKKLEDDRSINDVDEDEEPAEF